MNFTVESVNKGGSMVIGFNAGPEPIDAYYGAGMVELKDGYELPDTNVSNMPVSEEAAKWIADSIIQDPSFVSRIALAGYRAGQKAAK